MRTRNARGIWKMRESISLQLLKEKIFRFLQKSSDQSIAKVIGNVGPNSSFTRQERTDVESDESNFAMMKLLWLSDQKEENDVIVADSDFALPANPALLSQHGKIGMRQSLQETFKILIDDDSNETGGSKD
ncbi:hypothetical protein HHK36_010683 [Tetracentron sinense]|uniref:Uncharacterized protein n=1 Tax=Tetracentron sinense TaxID=13715 RepID=A0A834ZBG4_TETSI|nr:hypothetical protein HHK36_010683 [Tetracentron sinense]